jgi:5-formyltetrahydrofolate cyclo-ligase
MQKKELRKIFLEKRKSLNIGDLELFSKKICDRLFQTFPIHSYSNIHIFLPITKQNEINTWLIIKTLQKDFSAINIVIPRVNNDGIIENYLFNEKTKFKKSKWGIDEPIHHSSLIIHHSEIDLVLIPLLIFDKKGNRVGYGKGFYDKFLANCRADVLKIGLSVFEPIEAIDDINEFDIKLNYCVTPTQIWTF